jgi:hypothetical protein
MVHRRPAGAQLGPCRSDAEALPRPASPAISCPDPRSPLILGSGTCNGGTATGANRCAMTTTSQTGSSACRQALRAPGRAKSRNACWAYLLSGSVLLTPGSRSHWPIRSVRIGGGSCAGAWALSRRMKTKPVQARPISPGRGPRRERRNSVRPAWNHPRPCGVELGSERRPDFPLCPWAPRALASHARHGRGLPDDPITWGRPRHAWPVPAQCSRLSVLAASST